MTSPRDQITMYIIYNGQKFNFCKKHNKKEFNFFNKIFREVIKFGKK